MRPTAWTPEQDDLLAKYWKDGLSASQIAFRIGAGKTRCAIIGRVHRLGLAGRPNPSKASAEPKPRKRQRRPPGALAGMVVRPANNASNYKPRLRKTAMFNPVPQCRTDKPDLIALKDGECKFPFGNVPHIFFCGAKCEQENSPYCDAHRAIAYRPTEPIKIIPPKRWAA